MENMDTDPSLIDFLKTNGVPLIKFGSSEFGLSREGAVLFLNLLNRSGKLPLGIEVWRQKGNRYFIDSLGGWYSDSAAMEDNNWCSARKFISWVLLAEQDLLTVQY
jgi:hypothetical protein